MGSSGKGDLADDVAADDCKFADIFATLDITWKLA